MNRPKAVYVAILLLAMLAPAPALAQSADAVLRRVAAQATARAQGVDNYTVEIGGLASNVTLYTARRSPRSPYFDVKYAASGRLGGGMTDLAWGDIFQLMLQDVQGRARRDRRTLQATLGEIAGIPVHVVNFSFPESATGPQRLTAYYDTTTLLARRVEWVVRGATGDIQVAVEYDDYRPVQGMQIAFRRRIVTRGLRATKTAAELDRMRSAIEGLRAELPQQPEAEQAQSRRMIVALEGMLDRDELISETTVTSALLNQGPPVGVQLTKLGP